MGDLLVGNMVDHNGRRLNVVFLLLFLPPVIPGTVGDSPDDAGNGDPESAKQRQNRANTGDQEGQRLSAGPQQRRGKAAAEHTAGGAQNAAVVQVRQHAKAAGQRLTHNGQMIDGAAEKGKADDTDAAHGHGGLPAENIENKQVQQSRDGKIKSRFAHQAQNHRLDHLQQGPVGIDADNNEQDKQENTEQRHHEADGNGIFIFRLDLRSLGSRRGSLLPGLFCCGF